MTARTAEPKTPEAEPAAKPEPKDELKNLPLPEVETKLGSSPDGLSQAEAQERLAQYGPNELAEKKANPFLKFLTYCWGWAAFVWGYAVAWALVNDRVKLLAYRILDPTTVPLLAEKPADLTPRIAARAFELYQDRMKGRSQADQDWLEAEREIQTEEPKERITVPKGE